MGSGRVPALGPNFYAPTLLGDATVDMDLFREETFGPVAPLFLTRTPTLTLTLTLAPP